MGRSRRRGNPSWETRLLAVLTATLVVFGVAAVYGASSIVAVQQNQPGMSFALRQFQGALVGGILLLIVARLDYHLWERHAWMLVAIVAVLLVILLLPFTNAIAAEANGARRWIRFGGVGLQPSEFAKIAIVAWAAMLAAKKGDGIRDFKRGVVPFLVIIAPVTALILFEPDLSTAAVVTLIAGVVLFTAGARIGHFLLLGGVAMLVFWREIATVQYRVQRLFSFLSSGTDVADSSWQIQQSLMGMGAGRVVGVGFGEGMQKLGYLPYAYSDFIFSTIGEEWGFVGVVVLMLLFATMVWIGFRIAKSAPDAFGTLMATGLTAMIGVTAFLHMAVTLEVVPTTGLTLPFISYGRSSLLVSMIAVGILISIGESRPATRH